MAVWKVISRSESAEFVRYEAEPHGELETRRQWVRWHQQQAMAQAVDSRPQRPFTKPPEIAATVTRPTGNTERPAQLQRNEAGMQAHNRRNP